MKISNKPSSKTIEVFSDDRGVFVPILEHTEKTLTTNKRSIKRVYYVYNYGVGIIRGFHFHKHEWKYFIIVEGSAKFVAINPEKPADIYTFISSSRKANVITIPPGFANGWVSLEENTILLCCSTSTTQESLKDDTRFDPYKWGDVWKVKGR